MAQVSQKRKKGSVIIPIKQGDRNRHIIMVEYHHLYTKFKHPSEFQCNKRTVLHILCICQIH